MANHKEIKAEYIAVSENKTTSEDNASLKNNDISENNKVSRVKPIDLYKPSYHFVPDSDWMNDPNGLIYIDGVYHMFFQHDKIDKVFKDMSWGHAVSKDLIYWEHLENAIVPDELGMIYSGSCVIDKDNSAGFGTDTIFAFYTSTHPRQQQSMAYSLDMGRTFIKYEGNPVIANVAGGGIPDDFRDPKVMWIEEASCWVMLISVKDHIEFWTSSNLLDWSKASEFYGFEEEDLGMWECPDLIKVHVEDGLTKDGLSQGGIRKWVLLVSSSEGNYNGGSGTNYFIGDISIEDGLKFIPEGNSSQCLDYGKDNYASVSWYNYDGEKPIILGWLNNWEYAFDLPTMNRKGMMTLPREISLKWFNGSLKLVSEPVSQVQELLQHEVLQKILQDDEPIRDSRIQVGEMLMRSRVRASLEGSSDYGIKLLNSNGESIKIGYKLESQQFYIDRTSEFHKSIHKDFNEIHWTEKVGKKSKIQLDVYVDRSSVEVSFDHGECFMSELVFSEEGYESIEFYGDKEDMVREIKVFV